MSYEIITVNYFCVRHKNRRKHNQHSKLLFFKNNLHSGISDEIWTYGKLHFLFINSIYLVSCSVEMQRRVTQTKVYYNLFYSVWKETSTNLSKVAAVKTVFPKCVYHWYNLLRSMFFIPCDNFFIQIYRYPRFGATAILLRSLKQVFWKKSVYCIRYLHNSITMLLISNAQNTASAS